MNAFTIREGEDFGNWTTKINEDGTMVYVPKKCFVSDGSKVIDLPGTRIKTCFVHRAYIKPWTTWDITHIPTCMTLIWMTNQMQAIRMADILHEELPELLEIKKPEEILEPQTKRRMKQKILSILKQHGLLFDAINSFRGLL